MQNIGGVIKTLRYLPAPERQGDRTDDGRMMSVRRPGSPAQCQACMDVGKVRRDLPIDDPGFGKGVDCPACHGGADLISVSSALIEAGVPAEYVGFTLPAWGRKFASGPGAGEALSLGRAILKDRAALASETCPVRGLLLLGSTGTGKTSLLISLLSEIVTKTRSVRFVVYADLLDSIKRTWGSDRQITVSDAVGQLAFAEVLVIDEIGQGGEKVSEWQADVARQLAEVRWRAAQQRKLTFWTSNLDAAGLAKQFGDVVGPAVVSRIAGMSETVVFSGHDVRSN